MLTIRISRHQEIGIDALVHFELAPRLMFDYLADAVQSGSATVLITGEVATGKTTLLRALAAEIDRTEALLVIEDTHEIILRRPFVRTLLTRDANTEGAGKITPAQAIRTGLRMAMNRIILGEMRHAEAAEAFLDVCSSGHAGLSTLHARSTRDALSRLELLLVRAQGNLSVEAIQRQIANSVSVIVHLGADGVTGERRILEVTEVGSAADGHVQLSPVFTYAPQAGVPRWTRELGIPKPGTQLDKTARRLPPPGSSFGFDEPGLTASPRLRAPQAITPSSMELA
jgi:pilus assembly protein CpaF